MYSTSGAKKRSMTEASLRMTASRYAAISSSFDCLGGPTSTPLARSLFGRGLSRLRGPRGSFRWRCDRSPAFYHPVTLKAPQDKTMKLHFLARCVGPTPDIPADDLIAFGHHVFNRQVQIGGGLVHADHHLFVAVQVGGLSARSIVIVEVGRHIFVNDRRIPLVDEFFKVIPHKLFHLLGCQVDWHRTLS